MRKKNGFVLIETLVVVLLLTVTLMSLYATFSYMVSKTKERNNNDSIDTLYKTYFVKNVLDNYELANNDSDIYKDSFKYYAYSLMNSAGVSKNACHAYNYYDGREIIGNVNQDQFIICDFGEGGSNLSSADPLYESVKTYKITKMYYVDFSKIPKNETNKITVMNFFDASSIDYINQQSTDLEGNYLIVKYEKTYSYPTSHVESNLDVSTEAYHSSIALSEIVYNSTSKPIYFYSSTDDDAIKYASARTYSDGSQLILPSTVEGFTDHGGQSISAWSTSKEVTTDVLDQCLAAGSAGYTLGGSTVHCFYPNDLTSVEDETRNLYAFWCGDGTLSGYFTCQTQNSSSTLSNNDGVYRYSLGASDNYIVVGDYCWRLMSNFTSSSQGMKAIYSGLYDDGCPTDNVNVYIDKSVYNTYRGLNSAGYMLPVSPSEMSQGYYVDSNNPKKDLAKRANMLDDTTYSNREGEELWTFSTDTKITFGKSVKYDESTGLYTLQDTESPVTWYATKESNFVDLNNQKDKIVGHYACEDGTKTTCKEVYYVYEANGGLVTSFCKLKTTSCVWTNQVIYYYKVYKFQDGIDNSNVYDQVLYFTSDPGEIVGDTKHKITYDSNGVYISFNTLFNNKSYATQLRKLLNTRRYFCLAEPLGVNEGTTTCELNYVTKVDANTILDYIKLNTADTNTIEKYINHNVPATSDDIKENSVIKGVVDTWYKNNYYGKNISKVFDTNVTFANDISYYYPNDIFNITDWRTVVYNLTVRRPSSVSTSEFYNSYAEKDIYGMAGVSGTNGKLTYPIGLLTTDEAVYMGLTTNYNYSGFLYTSSDYFVMSPFGLWGNATITSRGALNYSNATSTLGVRPVVSILMNDSHVKIVSGDGSASKPIVINYS